MKKYIFLAAILVGCGTFTPSKQAELADKAGKTIKTLQLINGVTAPFDPFSPAISGILTLLAGVATTWGVSKHKQANKAEQITRLLVNGVEAAGTLAQPVKDSIKAQSIASGMVNEVNSTVQQILSGK